MAARSLTRDLRHDWRCWNGAERVIAMLLGAVLAFALPIALLIVTHRRRDRRCVT